MTCPGSLLDLITLSILLLEICLNYTLFATASASTLVQGRCFTASSQHHSDNMSLSNEYGSVTWPLKSFAISDDFKSPGSAQLLLDRANSEFGLIYQTEPGVAVMAQFPDTDEPVFFQVSKARAVCTRFNKSCKKVCVLMQHLQIDLNFTTGVDADDFLHTLSRLATKVGNLHFEVHEAASYVLHLLSHFNE